MDETADTVIRVLDRMLAIKDEAITGWLNFDEASHRQMKAIVELGDLSRELYYALHQDEPDGC